MQRVENNDKLIKALAVQAESAAAAGTVRLSLREQEEIERRQQALARQVPHEAETAEMILILTALAEENHLHQLRLSEERGDSLLLGGQPDKTSFVRSTIRWQGSGEYPELKNFLQELETSERLLTIDEINLRPTAGSESSPSSDLVADFESPRITVSLTIITYHDLTPSNPTSTLLPPENAAQPRGIRNPFQASVN